MEYQFIEKQKENLYSVYHPPETLSNEKTGIILCYPYGQEYIRCHKLYFNLANKLAVLGFHVLRFDYYGTGDSSGDFSLVRINESIEDIGLAINELKSSCDISKVILIGVRFGATLSLLCSKKYNVDGLVLWNPIIKGNKYLQSIEKDYMHWLSGSFTKEKDIKVPGISNFGFFFSDSLKKEIKNINVNKEDLLSNIPTLLIDESDLFNINDNTNTTFVESLNKEFWLKRENELNKTMVPLQEINKTLEWVRNTAF